MITFDMRKIRSSVRRVGRHLSAVGDTISPDGHAIITLSGVRNKRVLEALRDRGKRPLEVTQEQRTAFRRETDAGISVAIVEAARTGASKRVLVQAAIIRGAQHVVAGIRRRIIAGGLGVNNPDYLEAKRRWQKRHGKTKYGSAYGIRSGEFIEGIIVRWVSGEPEGGGRLSIDGTP